MRRLDLDRVRFVVAHAWRTHVLGKRGGTTISIIQRNTSLVRVLASRADGPLHDVLFISMRDAIDYVLLLEPHSEPREEAAHVE